MQNNKRFICSIGYEVLVHVQGPETWVAGWFGGGVPKQLRTLKEWIPGQITATTQISCWHFVLAFGHNSTTDKAYLLVLSPTQKNFGLPALMARICYRPKPTDQRQLLCHEALALLYTWEFHGWRGKDWIRIWQTNTSALALNIWSVDFLPSRQCAWAPAHHLFAQIQRHFANKSTTHLTFIHSPHIV